jgi:hypothetical protein
LRFFRRERRVVWLALFALASQLVLSFGHHVHVHAALLTAHAAAPGSCSSSAQAQCPAHDDEDETRCSICWTISIAGSLVVPAPAALLVPSCDAEIVDPQPLMAIFSDDETVYFQARAPPHAGSLA